MQVVWERSGDLILEDTWTSNRVFVRSRSYVFVRRHKLYFNLSVKHIVSDNDYGLNRVCERI